MKKKILVSLPYGMSARNYLKTSFINNLSKNFDITILSPLSSNKLFLNSFIKKNIIFINYPKISFVEKVFLKLKINLLTFSWLKKNHINSFEIIKNSIKQNLADDLLLKNKSLFSPVNYFLNIHIIKSCIFVISSFLDKYSKFKYLLDKNYDLVLLTHPYVPEERIISSIANYLKIPAIASIHSWDNITTKPYIFTKYEKIVVWNKIMKRQLIDFYNYPNNDIFISGMIQSDLAHNYKSNINKKKYLKLRNVPSNRKVISYACGCSEFVPNQYLIVKFLAELVNSNKLIYDCALVIRSHPGIFDKKIEEIASLPNVYLDVPSPAFNPNNVDPNFWINDSSDIKNFNDFLFFSDVVINCFSTTTIDAALFDKPIINIYFDADGDTDYLASVKKHYDWNHYSPIVKSNGVCMAKSYSHLIFLINRYLNNPKFKRLGRLKIVNEQVEKFDGKSSLSLSNFINDFLKNKTC